MADQKAFQIGDRVAFSRAWLRSVCAFTGEKAFLRGTVVEEVRPGARECPALLAVAWDARLRHGGLRLDTPDESRVLASNLVRVDRIPFEPV